MGSAWTNQAWRVLVALLDLDELPAWSASAHNGSEVGRVKLCIRGVTEQSGMMATESCQVAESALRSHLISDRAAKGMWMGQPERRTSTMA